MEDKETKVNKKEFDRTQGLGGSDISALLGFSKWKTPPALYLEKIGEIDSDAAIKQNSRHIFDMGRMLEPYVIQSFEEETEEKVVRQQERIFHPKHKFLWATIDGMCSNFVIEIKTTSLYVDDWKHSIPLYVLAQVVYYSSLLNSDGAKIVVMFRDSGEIRTYSYQRDTASEEQIIKQAVEFWDNVRQKTPPEPSSYAEAQILFKDVVVDKKVIATSEDIVAVVKMLQLKKEMDEKKEFNALKIGICAKLKDAPVLEDGQGNCLVTWKTRNGTRFSIDALKTTYPNIYSECLLRSTVRNFNLTQQSNVSFG